MFVIESARFNYYKSPRDKEILDKAIPLIKSVFGYTDEEIEKFKQKLFYPPLAINLTLEQARLAMQPFWDIDFSVFVSEYDDNTYDEIEHVHSKRLGLISQSPQEHYYDEPVVRRDQLIDPYNPPTWNTAWVFGYTFNTTPAVTCPYCKSTDTKKITNTSKAVHTALFGIFSISRNSKQWHCNKCGSDF